ncbi:MAG: WbqC family protein [Chitinophagales bacterium]
MQPVLLYLPYLPSVGWFKDYLSGAEVFIEAEENFVKSSKRNRAEIVGGNGRLLLSIPVAGGRDHHQKYRDTQTHGTDWQKSHWQSLRSAYGSSPFFEHYGPVLEPLFNGAETNLFAFNLRMLNTLLRLLKSSQQYALTTAYTKQPEGVLDYRSKAGSYTFKRYYQVFEDRHGFQADLSVVDLLFNLGPQSLNYLKDI